MVEKPKYRNNRCSCNEVPKWKHMGNAQRLSPMRATNERINIRSNRSTAQAGGENP